MNKKTGIILAVVIANIVLVGTVVTLYFTVLHDDDQVEEGKIIITGLVDQQINLTLVDLEMMPNITREYTILGNPDIKDDYTGVPLEYLITEVANITENYRITVYALDGLARYFYLNDIIANPGFIIAYKRGGEYLKSMSEGGNGPFRLIVPEEYNTNNGQFCVKYVSEIEILDL